ncbi:glucosamine--fructose-6-phosphate aminotransferase [Candidatus Photodesmus blepharus]|uniref:Glutamine--fructose-6-phosphate aminotransferase [isomerizing] n=1 Tax=Candidatus Photodesmus blepharonis TaxID=1179155 RepID=A0A084CMK4_9GAMM|nr:glutamine--fructose-6-phosphate transaminase (isomerizing) [Candidatus Photodesmus blepharus]KEY91033.1 glucosamine--fructose-6-phosphate aminotransferase [Candidatus Photodesmus blepharus]
MCGIIGAVAQRNVAEILIEGLRRLEYRGYDSAGIAVINQKSNLTRIRRLGKVKELAEATKQQELSGNIGIAHTRWATHGAPSEINAHPHISGNIAVVHNGIIENHEELRATLQNRGYVFESESDTETIAHLVEWESRNSTSLRQSVQKAIIQLEGTYGAVIVDRQDSKRIIAARSGSPIVIGFGVGENFLASDQLALRNVAQTIMYLEEGDIAEITHQRVDTFDSQGKKVERKVTEFNAKNDEGRKGKYRHFMKKEIFEQPTAFINTMKGRITQDSILTENIAPNFVEILKKVEHIKIVACGTSYHAAMTARYWFENLANISCDAEIASEFRYRKFVTHPNTLLITLSQSGETADTLAALRLAKKKDYMLAMTICNMAGSSLVRESDLAFMMRAGIEIGVASTKAFTTQLVTLLILATALGKHKQSIDRHKEREVVEALHALPKQVKAVLSFEKKIQTLAADFANKKHTLFLGRGEFYPIAMEASLKLKEISYIHAEAYAAGELKHGPLALIDSDMPVIVIAPNNELLEKLKSNIEEVRARGGLLYVFADENAGFNANKTMKIITLPHVAKITAPIYYTIPMQLLSYHVALIKGTDVDQPRNLAKSVTVE